MLPDNIAKPTTANNIVTILAQITKYIRKLFNAAGSNQLTE